MAFWILSHIQLEMLLHDYSVSLPLHIVIVVMHFSDDLGEKLSIMYNYTAIQIELEEPKPLFAVVQPLTQLVV